MFADVLKELRTSADISRSTLAKALNVSVGTISNYENNLRVPHDTETWRRIANYFNVSVDYLMSSQESDEQETDKPFIHIDNSIPLPIYGTVSAGIGAYADNDIIGYENIPQDWIKSASDYVLLQVKGDSMYPVFMENDLLLVKCQPVVESGEYAVVLIDGNEGVVKQFIQRNNTIELVSKNPMYPPRKFEGEAMDRIRIFGLVKRLIRKYE